MSEFVPCKLFQISLMFVGEAGAYPRRVVFSGKFLSCPHTLDQAGKACYGQTLWFITKICELRIKKFKTMVLDAMKLLTAIIYECSY
jgi:hypothetical protein